MRGLFAALTVLLLSPVFGNAVGTDDQGGVQDTEPEGFAGAPFQDPPFAVRPGMDPEDLGKPRWHNGWQPFVPSPCAVCGGAVQVPTSQIGTAADHSFSGLAHPVPADDVDMDGVEDVFMVSYPRDTVRDETAQLTLSGATGAASVWTEAADFIAPSMTLQTTGGPIVLAYVLEERHVVKQGRTQIWLWDGHLVARDPVAGEKLWTVETKVHLGADLSGSWETVGLSTAGPMFGDDAQGVLVHWNYTWKYDFFKGRFVDTERRMIDLRSGGTLYDFPVGPLPSGFLRHADGAALYGHEGGQVRFWDAASGETLSDINVSFDTFRSRQVVVRGDPALLVLAREQDRSTDVALVDHRGQLLWERRLPVTQYMQHIGVADGSSVVSFAQVYFDCDAGIVDYTQGSFTLPEAEILWRQETRMDLADVNGFSLTLSIGDLDGDGIGDPSLMHVGERIHAVIKEGSQCEGYISWTLATGEEVEGNWTVRSGLDGSLLVEMALEEMPGSPVLFTLDPTSRVSSIPFFEHRLFRLRSVEGQELWLHTWDRANGTTSSVLVDARTFGPLTSRWAWAWFPLAVFGGPVDEVVIYWGASGGIAGQVEDGRFGVHTHGAHDAQPIWAYLQESPQDIPLPESVTPLPRTPLER